ncbi:type IV secretion system DNA-binding domain-containing protein, partial [Dokdonella soli]
ADIQALVQGLPAQSLFHPGNERMLSNVRGIVGTYLAPYNYLPGDAGPKSWSIRRHVQEGQGWLWLPYREDQRAALRPLLATWLGEAINAMLSMSSDLDRRRWLLLDEVASLGCVQGLSDALTRGRKYGLCAILGLQSVAQLRGAYGDDGAQTLLSCLSSQLILRANDPETADYASRHLGKCTVVRTSATYGGKNGPTRTRVEHTEELVLASEIQSLPDRRGYLRLAGQNRVRCVKIPIIKRAPYAEPFEPRPLERSAPSSPPSPPAITPSPNLPPRPVLDADAILGAGRE